MKKYLFSMCFGMAALLATAAEPVKPITVFAAASTANAVKEIAADFTRATGTPVKINAGSSGDLVRQMENGAPSDVYISADAKWMTYAIDKKLVDPATAKKLMSTSLVIIVPADSIIAPFTVNVGIDLPSMFKGRLAVGDPAHVPAGTYAVAALKYYKWYDALKNRLLPAQNVRAALQIVEMGEVEMGIVYSTDAASSKKVKMVAEFPAESHPPVEYLLAESNGASPAGREFHKYLLSDSSAKIIKKYGFVIKANLP